MATQEFRRDKDFLYVHSSLNCIASAASTLSANLLEIKIKVKSFALKTFISLANSLSTNLKKYFIILTFNR